MAQRTALEAASRKAYGFESLHPYCGSEGKLVISASLSRWRSEFETHQSRLFFAPMSIFYNEQGRKFAVDSSVAVDNGSRESFDVEVKGNIVVDKDM